jgi:hypothetical protein
MPAIYRMLSERSSGNYDFLDLVAFHGGLDASFKPVFHVLPRSVHSFLWLELM